MILCSEIRRALHHFGVVLLCGAVVAGGNETSPATTGTSASAPQVITNAANDAPAATLKAAGEHAEPGGAALTQVDLLAAERQQQEARNLAAYQDRLKQAINLREAGNNVQASEHLVSLLKSGATEEVRRAALLELAVTAQADNQYARAQQIYAQYISQQPKDPTVPEILLRQGLLYRQMGANRLAVSKFYGVMSAALTLKPSDFEYHRRLVLRAQTEIADTYYLQGDFQESAAFLELLLKLDSVGLNKSLVRFKLIRSRSALGEHVETIAASRNFLDSFPGAPERAEVRFLLAKSLKFTGQTTEALKELAELLSDQQSDSLDNRRTWVYWQQRIGNEIANQLYQEGDYMSALHLYSTLASLDRTPGWQLPVQYQIGLIYERLQQPLKAIESYDGIVVAMQNFSGEPDPELKTVADMAGWRRDFLTWQGRIESHGTNAPALTVAPDPVAQTQ